MMSLFKKQRKTPRPLICVSMHDGDGDAPDGDLPPSFYNPSDERPRKLRKQSQRASLPSKPSSHSTTRTHETDNLNDSLTLTANSNSKGGNLATLGIAEAVFDPNYYTTLLLQASDARCKSQSNPSTPPPSPSRYSRSNTNYIDDRSPLTPPSTPLNQDSLRLKGAQILSSSSDDRNLALNRKASRMLDPILEGVTYDAILTSTLNKTLGNDDDDHLVPPTQVPPNTPAPVIQEGGFASLMCLSVAIMEGKIHDLPDMSIY
ncbi:hypothetical protein BJ165DRAFT_1468177 [Panaeolus papilionaceus]|nr:hypothetical protein BJ165DRAFT_1468177 [Panaeolus papilionaceus]